MSCCAPASSASRRAVVTASLDSSANEMSRTSAICVPGTNAHVTSGTSMRSRAIVTSMASLEIAVLDRDGDLGPRIAAHQPDDLVGAQPVGRLAIDGEDQVARSDARSIGRCAVDDRDDDRSPTALSERGADARDAALQRLLLGGQLLGSQEDRVTGVAKRLDHAPDGAVGELLVGQLGASDVSVADQAVCLPEQPEVRRGVGRLGRRRSDRRRRRGRCDRRLGARWQRWCKGVTGTDRRAGSGRVARGQRSDSRVRTG